CASESRPRPPRADTRPRCVQKDSRPRPTAFDSSTGAGPRSRSPYTWAMKMTITGWLLLCSAALSLGAQQRPDAARAKQQLIGSYKLVSFVNIDQNGVTTKSPFTIGQISYDAAGRMSAQLMREGRARLTTPQSSETERATAYSGFISYFGHYTIAADNGPGN